MRECRVCGKPGNLHRHHVIYSHGKRKVWETRESLIDICYDCHKLVHTREGFDIDMRLKLQLQAEYFKKGYSAEKVQQLMAGKLYLLEGKIWGTQMLRTTKPGL